MDTEKIIKELLGNFGDFSIDDIPDIDLYMDQVTTLLNGKFEVFKRNDEDKLLTKTMINNYAKFRLLPSPEKKKYSKDHIIVLIMIYFFKNVLSIQDISCLISPAIEQFFHNEEQSLASVYNAFVTGIKEINDNNEMKVLYEKCSEIFDFEHYENKEYLQTLAYITLLSYQAYVRQQLVIKLIDNLSATPVSSENKTAKDEKNKSKN